MQAEAFLRLIICNLRIPVEKDGEGEYQEAVSQRLKICATDIRIVKILGKTIDTSDKEQFYREFSIVVSVPDGFDNKENLPVYSEK